MTHFKKNKSRIKQISIETNKQCMHNGKGMWPLKKKKKIAFTKYQNLLE